MYRDPPSNLLKQRLNIEFGVRMILSQYAADRTEISRAPNRGAIGCSLVRLGTPGIHVDLDRQK